MAVCVYIMPVFYRWAFFLMGGGKYHGGKKRVFYTSRNGGQIEGQKFVDIPADNVARTGNNSKDKNREIPKI
jgi:hypothetical protein